MVFRQLLNPETSTFTYFVGDPPHREALVIDPTPEHVERDAALLESSGLEPILVLLTYTTAERIRAADAIRRRTRAPIVSRLGPDGGANVAVGAGYAIDFGSNTVHVLDTPGYTDDSVSYLVGRRVFTGGALSVRRCGRNGDPVSDPDRLYDSVVGVLFELPDDTLVYPAHHQGGVGVTTIGTERLYNPDVAARDRAAFLARSPRSVPRWPASEHFLAAL